MDTGWMFYREHVAVLGGGIGYKQIVDPLKAKGGVLALIKTATLSPLVH